MMFREYLWLGDFVGNSERERTIIDVEYEDLSDELKETENKTTSKYQ